MRIAELDPTDLRKRLRGEGLALRSGPWVALIRSDIEAVADGIALHYAVHELGDSQGFIDFPVFVQRPCGLRRWWRRQVIFSLDGQTDFAPLPGDQGFPMLEWGLNWCVSTLCHQYLVLHAAVLERGGRAVLLPAPSGSGKSTLCAALAFRGWRLLSDELAVIDPADGSLVPLPRPISLKNASIEVVQRFVPEATFNTPVHETVKGTVAHATPPADAVLRSATRAFPGWVVLPKFVPDAPATLTPLRPGAVLMRLIENAFNYNVHGARGFEVLSNLIEHSQCHAFSYSQLSEACAVFEALAQEPAPAGDSA